MKRLFGAPKAAPPSGPAPSLSDASGKMDKRVTDLEGKIAKCDEDLRRYLQGGRGAAQQKQLALQTMKRKKMYEQQLQTLLGTQFNIDSLAGSQEQAEMTVTAVEAMRAGQQDLKQRYAALGGVGDIEKLMDDMADMQDEISDINEAISTSYAVPDGFDEAAFEEEFSALEEEITMEKLTGMHNPARPTYLPSQPASQPASEFATVPPPSAPADASSAAAEAPVG